MRPRNLDWETSITRVLALPSIIRPALIGMKRPPSSGDARARVALASIYLTGHGRPTNREEAARLFVQAAEQGEARGLYQAALMHLSGDGLPENIDKAETYLRKAAKQRLPARHHQPCRALYPRQRHRTGSSRGRELVSASGRAWRCRITIYHRPSLCHRRRCSPQSTRVSKMVPARGRTGSCHGGAQHCGLLCERYRR